MFFWAEYFSRFTILEDSGAAAGSSRVSGERAEAARRKGLVRAARDLSPLFWTHHAPGARSAAGDLPAAMTCRRLCSFCSLTSALSFSRSLFCRSSTSCDAAEVLPPLPMVRVPPTHTYRDPSGTGEQSRVQLRIEFRFSGRDSQRHSGPPYLPPLFATPLLLTADRCESSF